MPTDKEMLTLAVVTYRGINLVLPEAIKRARLRQLMDECMNNFSAVKGKWKIVWGPADFNTVSPGFDDALMYVARSADQQNLAIAIRGTNPISVTDWLFGDFMFTHQTPWVYGDPASIKDAKISASSALGLGILQHLRWDDAVLGAELPATKPASPDGWLQAVKARLQSSTAVSALQKITANFNNAKPENFDPLGLLQQIPGAERPNGTDLKTFLRDHVKQHPTAEIYVTGHSKGGVLCSTLALWLADTRGKQADQSQQWCPDGVPVHAYSFAAPTAGNQEFAAHSDQVLTDCHRIWNKLDAVPYAFVVEDLVNVASLYGLNPIEKAVLNDLIQKLIAAVKPLHYTQICGAGEPFSAELVPMLPFPLQILHQHLQSYLDNVGLTEMTAASLLAPVL